MAEEVAPETIDTGGAKQTAKDLFAGAAGGVAQVLLGRFEEFSLFFPLWNVWFWAGMAGGFLCFSVVGV